MAERSTGIILRTRPLTETSLIVHWLTPELGRIATVAKGARRPKSPFRGKLDLFYEADFSFGRSRNTELHNLHEVVLRNAHSALRQSLGWLHQASYFVALVEQTTETETPLPTVFALLRDSIEALTSTAPCPRTVFAFELKLLEELGLMPDLDAAGIGAGARQVAEILKRLEWKMIARVKLSEAQVREIRQFLHGFLIYHLERIPRSRSAAVNAT